MGIVYPQESYQIMGACFEVYKQKGCGFLEPAYQECLELELNHRLIPFKAQPLPGIYFKGSLLTSRYTPDFFASTRQSLSLRRLRTWRISTVLRCTITCGLRTSSSNQL